MATTLNATFDGTVLRLDTPLELPPNTRVRVTVEAEDLGSGTVSFLRTARSLKLQGPPDWSEQLEHQLYGDPATDDE